jgi:hypothetical protein
MYQPRATFHQKLIMRKCVSAILSSLDVGQYLLAKKNYQFVMYRRHSANSYRYRWGADLHCS